MFTRRFPITSVLVSAAALIMLSPQPAAAQYRGGFYRGGYSRAYYPGYYRGYGFYPGYYRGYAYRAGYPWNYGYYARPGPYWNYNALGYYGYTYAPQYYGTYAYPAVAQDYNFIPGLAPSQFVAPTTTTAFLRIQLPADADQPTLPDSARTSLKGGGADQVFW